MTKPPAPKSAEDKKGMSMPKLGGPGTAAPVSKQTGAGIE